jgi:RimJ/RimL family protein N-acetyltransferase
MSLLPDKVTNSHLELRRWSLDHLDAVLAAVDVSFNELHTWLIWAATKPTRLEMHNKISDDVVLFDSDERWQFFIFECSTDELVGSAGLHRRGKRDELEIGYWIRSDRTRRGYATEAAALLTSAAFNANPALRWVNITMDAMNHASAGVPKKLGFTRQGEQERDVVAPGHSGRGAKWSMERRDWIAPARI